MELRVVCRTEPALVWEIAVGSRWASVVSETQLHVTVLLVRGTSAPQLLQAMPGEAVSILWGWQLLGRPFIACSPVPTGDSWQWRGAAMSCVSPSWIMAHHKPELEIHFWPSIAKALHLCASICDGYSPLKAHIRVWWWVTKVQNIFWEAHFFWPAPEMFSWYLPWLSGAAWENMISPVRSRKTFSPWLPRYWSSRKEPPEATTHKMVVLKEQHLGFGPQKHAGISTSERQQSYMGRSCRNWDIIGEQCVCVCARACVCVDRARRDGESLGTCISCGFIIILAYGFWTAALQLLGSWLSWHYLQTLKVLGYRGLSSTSK